jgi:hypothetical protein
MARDDHSDGVGRARTRHGAHCLGVPDRLSDLAIRARPAVGDLLQFLPDPPLERRRSNVEGPGKTKLASTEIIPQGLDPSPQRGFVSLSIGILLSQGFFEGVFGISKLHGAQAALGRPDEQEP